MNRQFTTQPDRPNRIHTVEKIGGTSMSNYTAVKDNIVLAKQQGRATPYQRIFVVSAYGGITDLLLEHKKSGEAGVFSLFSGAEEGDAWKDALAKVRRRMLAINAALFSQQLMRQQADHFIVQRLDETKECLENLAEVCQHGHFSLATHLHTVKEMLASLGEAHSAWNMTKLLKSEGINARFVDLTGWNTDKHLSLEERIEESFAEVNLETELPVVTGYAHTKKGLMASFDRGYSEMTLSAIAVLTGAREAIIHKEYHLSSADPGVVGENNVVPIGRTNYDVADQLANLGMEAIHPRAAKGLRQNAIPLRVMNTFEPEHSGTLITGDYVSEEPCVEIIAGRRHVYALELFDQDMMGQIQDYDRRIIEVVDKYRASVVTKDINANTITHYLATNLKTVKRIETELIKRFADAEIKVQQVAVVSAIGSDMQVSGMLAKTVAALADAKISVLAMHQSMRQVDMQFIIEPASYTLAIQSLHQCLIEVHDHGKAICVA